MIRVRKYRKKMKNQLVSLIFVLLCLTFSYSQDTLENVRYADLDEFVVNRHFQQQYKRELDRVKKIYPMAIKAKAIMDEYDAQVAALDKKKDIRKYSHKMNAYLKDEFTYSIRDLYTSEGRLLLQLIHRETGKTVDQILTEYAGAAQAFMYRNMAKMFNQDLKSTYNKSKQNYYTEIVIQDILNGEVEFNPVMDKMTKEAFKLSQEQYRQEKRDYKVKKREYKAIVKKKEKEEKKAAKSAKK